MKQNFYFDIIILATQRSGSTLICDDLRNVGKLGLPEEYFIPANKLTKEPENCRNFIKRIIEKSKDTLTCISAVKIMGDQLERANQVYNIAELDQANKNSQYLYLHNARFVIYCYRANLIKQAISRLMARKTGICHRIEDISKKTFAGQSSLIEDDYNLGVNISPDDVLVEAKKIKKENEIILKIINEQGVNVIISS